MPAYLERYDLFVFDLDGTLADTAADIAVSLNHALEHLGREPLTLEEVTRLVGNGARVLLRLALGAAGTDEGVERGLAAFLEHYRLQCVRQTRLYPGVRECLEGLAGAPGRRDLAVLTNKPLDHSERILQALGVRGFFRRVLGGDNAPARKPHPGGLLLLMEDLGHRPGRTLLVGDSATDAETARAAGTAVALVPYGFQPQAWHEARPDPRIGSLVDLIGG
jgi:phosphoglycolate phosphatase